MNPETKANVLRNERVFRSLSYVLVCILMGCVALTISILIHNIVPEWHYGIIAGASLFVVIDRLYTYRQMKSLTFLSKEWVIALVSQWVVILLVIRLLLSYANGAASLREHLTFFARRYIDKLLTPEFVITLLLAFFVWYITRLFLDLIDEIGLDQAITLSEERPLVQGDMVPPHKRMVNLVFTLGLFLVILTAMTRMNLRAIAANSSGLPHVEFSRFSGAEAGALFYFVIGLALLSLSRLMSLQTHWNLQRIPVSSKHLARQWGMYSLIFFLILAVFVGLLPSGDNVGFFTLLGTLFSFLLLMLLFLAQIVIGLILMLLSLPFLFLGKAPPIVNNSAPPVMPVLPTQPITSAASNETWVLIRSMLLWGLLIAIIIFALVQFVRRHETILPALRRSRVVNWLILAWQWLYTNVGKTRGSVSQALADGWQNIVSRLEGRRILPPVSLINLRTLDPRRRVFFFYHAMIRRGGEQNIARKPSQTPSEYAATLENAVPPAGEDIDSMTEAFIKARYSSQPVNPSDADAVKDAWGRVRHELQEKLKRKKENK